MILFCDTSALMKAYAEEMHSALVRDLIEKSTGCFVSLITWPEMCAAFGLKHRTQQITSAEVAIGLERLSDEWGGYGKISVDTQLMLEAGELALRFGLRAYDSIQLASVQRTHQQLGKNLTFCCFDKQLNTAATSLEINLMEC